jgi:ParB/RepB/Spo0J family partition protein
VSKFKNLPRTGLNSTPVSAGREKLEKEATSTRKLLGALIVPVRSIVPNPTQARSYFNEEALQELAEDIKERGILEPLLVRVNQDEMYEIIAGERRYRAAKIAGLDEVPVIVKDLDDEKAELASLVENIQRENLSFEDEQRYYQLLQNKFNYSITDIAKKINKSRYYVRQRLNGVADEGAEMASPPTDGDKNHNSVKNAELSKKSQSGKKAKPISPKFSPAVFKRFSSTVDNTLLYLENKQPDPKSAKQMQDTLEELETRLNRLKQKLADFS